MIECTPEDTLPRAGYYIEQMYEQIPGQPYRFKESLRYFDTVKEALAVARELKKHKMCTGYNIFDKNDKLWGGWRRDYCFG